MELEVSLQFECCQCSQPVGVTLKCEGIGLLGGYRTVATVKIPCPGCGSVNNLYFEPSSGRIHGVESDRPYRPFPEPSMN